MAIKLVHPLPDGRPTDKFGWRPGIPGVVGPQLHTGQDYAAHTGTPIFAAHAGQVTRIWWDTFTNGQPAGGNMLQITGSQYATRYAHLSRYAVTAGQKVKAGQIIGYVGATGAATGPHLHFELLLAAGFADPVPYIRASLPPKPEPAPALPEPEQEEEPMKAIYYRDGNTYQVAIFHPVSGLFTEYTTTDSAYNNRLAAAFETGSFLEVTPSHYNRLKADFEKVRQGK